jgi:hypothetical protein
MTLLTLLIDDFDNDGSAFFAIVTRFSRRAPLSVLSTVLEAWSDREQE